ncbi:MAG: hypothetical protein KJ710_03610 [Candidatus Omnitrophica bacterium]|nr:hypothetical protein [Candidatus Omnitrophota bacterium]MBU1923337.1 hypothetical protein [Candidatus Omnitrophota bacterium]
MTSFLFSLVLLILCFPSILYSQMSWSDKSRMQKQSDQAMSKYDQLKTNLKVNSSNSVTQAQEVAHEKQVGAVKFQGKHEEAEEIFNKFSTQSQQSSMYSMVRVYIFPVLIIAAIGVIFMIVWYKSI